MLLHHFARSPNPEGAVGGFDRFLAGLHGGSRLFSLLRQNPDLIALVALVLGAAPRLADALAHFPHVMDAVIDPSFFGALPEEAELASELDRSLQQAGSYEDFLDRVRIFAQEQMFLIGTRILSGTASAEQAGEAFARLADVLIRSLHGAIEENFARTHGRVAEQETAILALGKLGGREMTASSDLDLIVVYDFDSERPESDGARPLYGAQYFSRLTQRLISALSAQTNYGHLYHVDMRLRPSGRSGPVATQIDRFASYQESEAWTWEHMALTRARVVSASREFCVRVETVIRNVLCRPREPDTIAGDVVEMRRAIAIEKGDEERWNLKYVAGGLIDIEFIAQYLQLVHAANSPEILDNFDCARAGQGMATWPAGRGRCGNLAPGGAALSRSHANPAAVPAGRVRSQAGSAWTARPAGARRRCPRFRHARGIHRRDPGESAQELHSHPGRFALNRALSPQRH